MAQHLLATRTRRDSESDDSFAGSRSEAPRDSLAHNLPVSLTSFVGREHEMLEVGRLLSTSRLLTLTGAGGSGKTRLALQMARDPVQAYPDGVWLVELAPLSDPAQAPQAVAAVLGVREQPNRPLAETLADHLRNEDALLVLDNCEHVVDGAARLADALLGVCPDLRILATSREPLGVPGEAIWTVPPLTLPDADETPTVEALMQFEAVRLFMDRARSRRPAFELTENNARAVAEVCRKLDGIPLAIELATARMGALAVEQVAERLEDSLKLLTGGVRTVAPRHQTVRATIAWSHQLLPEPEKRLFAKLSVFAGGWTLEAAEAVCPECDEGRLSTLDLLARLVDKSLVLVTGRGGEARYRLLETVRQYASEKLESGGEERAVRQRHALFFLDLAERAESELSGARQAAWLERLEGELDNLRAAMGWFLESDQSEPHLRLAGALWRYCYLHGHYHEGWECLERALAGGGEEAPPSVRAKALLGAGVLAFLQCDYDHAVGRLEESLALYRVLEDRCGVASASQTLGSIARERGDYARSEALHQESLALYGSLADEVGEARSLNYLGYVAWLQDDHERARELCEETLLRFRRLGDNEGIVWALISLGSSAHYSGDPQRGREHLEVSLALSREVGYKEGVAWSLNQLGALFYHEGDQRQAEESLRESLEIHLNLGDRWRVASVLEALAEAYCAQGRLEPAARLFGCAQTVREFISVPVPMCERADREESVSATRAGMGEAAFQAAWSEGRATSPEQALAYAPGGQTEEPPAHAAPATNITPLAPDPQADSGERPAETIQAQPTTAGLRIFALGAARVEKEGRPLESEDWTHKPRELLFFLLSHPKGRTKEQIGLALWPEASNSQLRSSFHDTVFRLRRALGAKEWVSFAKGRYSFGRSLDYSFDVDAFEEHIARARGLRSHTPEEAIRHLEDAIALYGDDFLEGEAFGEWAYERQEELRREYQDALMLLGGLLSAQGCHAEAAEAYRKAVSHDGFVEEAHRGLMRSYGASGERGRALRHYEGLVRMLEERLGASPAPETSELHESLRAGVEV